MSPPLPPPPLPGFAGIIQQNDLKSKQPRLPWRTKNGLYQVIIYTEKAGIKTPGDVMGDAALIKAGLDSYMEHYFPEFYPFIANNNAVQIADHEVQYYNLRGEIESSMSAATVETTNMGFMGTPFTSATKIVFQTLFNFATRREEMVAASSLPPFELALETFNITQDYGEAAKSVNFDMTTTPDLVERLSGQLNSFGDFMRQMANDLEYNLNFGFLAREVREIVNALMTIIYDTIDPEGSRPVMEATDYISVYFDDQNHIVRIEYFFVTITEGNTETSKVGYITNIKNNLLLQNPLSRNILANYEEILRDIDKNKGLDQQTNIIDFLQQYAVAAESGNPGKFGAFGNPFGPDSPVQPPFNNIFATSPMAGAGAGSRAVEPDRMLNARDFDDLTKKIKSFISYEEIAKIDEAAKDPELRSRMVQKEKAKKINAAVQVTKIIDKIATFNFPLAGPNKSKEARIINQVLSQFGIQQLAREALICLTFGIGAATQRITGAVRDSLTSTDLYNRPRNPSDELNLERPKLGDFKAYFSITGDPPLGKQILNIILNALANAGFEIIKALADLIKLNCNDVIRAMVGAVDCGEELRALNDQAQIPDLGDILYNIAAGYGFTGMPQAYDYLSDVSKVLDVVELCRLLNAPDEVEVATLNKVIAFNRQYHVTAIQTNLVTGTEVISFFERVSEYVDTVTLCNRAVNNLLDEVRKSCNVCLDEDFYDGLEKTAAIQELTNLIEHGPIIEIPPFDFMCPDSEFFINNPVYSVTLPNAFNALVDSIQLYFGGSLESARASLLMEGVTNEPNPQQDAIDECGLTEDPVEIDTAVLNIIKDIFSKLAEGIQFIADNANSPVCADLDLSKFPDLDSLMIALEAITAGLEASPDAIQGVVDNINAAQSSITEGSAAPVARVEPVFPILYKQAFANAIGYLNFSAPTDLTGATTKSTGGIQSGSIIKSATSFEIGALNAEMYEAMSISYDFNKSNVNVHQTDDMIITWPPYSTDEAPYVGLSYNIPFDVYSSSPTALPLNGSFTETVNPAALPMNEIYKTKLINPHVYRFIDAYGLGALENSDWLQVAAQEFPLVQAASARRVFDYCLRKGAFSVARVQNLNLFKNNANCSPADIGDLLDADGIIDQMKKNFLDDMCSTNAGVNISEGVRRTLEFGIINLLIQAVLIQFIIKNITVFSAFKMSDIFSIKYPLRDYIIAQVATEVRRHATAGTGMGQLLRSAMIGYFESRSTRQSTQNVGGITHSYAPTELVTGFTAPQFSYIGNMQQMISFLVNERIGYTWGQEIASDYETGTPITETRSTMTAIGNIMDSGPNKKPYSRVFLENAVGVYNGFKQMWTDKTSGGQTTQGDYAWGPTADKGDFSEINGNMGILKEVVVDAAALSSAYQNLFAATTGTVTMSAEMFSQVFSDMVAPSDISVQYTLYLFDRGTGIYVDQVWNWETLPESNVGMMQNAAYLASNPALRLPKALVTIPVASTVDTPTGGPWASVPPAITGFLGNISSATGNLIMGITTTDYQTLGANSELQLFLDQCASQNTAIMAPLLYNLYLSDKYFTTTVGSFDTTIIAILNLLKATDDSRRPPTASDRSAAQDFNNSMADSDNNLESLAREIFLKFLKETPLQILKGLVELIDPHVAISKFIRDVTAEGFGMAAKGITTVIDAMPDEPPNPLKENGATGEDILALAFCGYNLGNQFASEAANLPTAPWDAESDEGSLFGPRISLNGVDFTGTVTGMFMLPPSPLGIIYLLLKFLLDQIELPDGSEEEGEPTDTSAEC